MIYTGEISYAKKKTDEPREGEYGPYNFWRLKVEESPYFDIIVNADDADPQKGEIVTVKVSENGEYNGEKKYRGKFIKDDDAPKKKPSIAKPTDTFPGETPKAAPAAPPQKKPPVSMENALIDAANDWELAKGKCLERGVPFPDVTPDAIQKIAVTYYISGAGR